MRRSPAPPISIGSGCCTGSGRFTASLTEWCLPSYVNASCGASSPFQDADGVAELTDANAGSREVPAVLAVLLLGQPAPTSMRRRPFEMRSSVDAIFASSAGLRNDWHSTWDPTRTRSVAVARADITVQASRMPFGGGKPRTWSITHRESTPTSSANFASSRTLSQSAATCGSTTPMCISCLPVSSVALSRLQE